MKYYTRNTINFIVGESAEENWKAILQAKRDHTWIHVDGRSSAHIIIDSDELFEEDIEYACNLCAEQTKITNIKNQLYVVSSISNIKLGSNPGEVIIRDESKLSYYLLKKSAAAD